MPFSIPTTLNITGIVQSINKVITLTEENVHQVDLTVPPSTTDQEVFLDITDLSKVKSLFLTTSSPITYSFTAGGTDYNLNSAIMLLGGSAAAFQNLEELTGGTIVVGQRYFIKNFLSGDSFTSAGASSDATNIGFVATASTATWSNGSTLVTSSKELTSIFLSNSNTATTVTFKAVMVISND